MRGVAELAGKAARDLTDIAFRRADRPPAGVEAGQRTEIELARGRLESRLGRGLEGLRARLRRGLAERSGAGAGQGGAAGRASTGVVIASISRSCSDKALRMAAVA